MLPSISAQTFTHTSTLMKNDTLRQKMLSTFYKGIKCTTQIDVIWQATSLGSTGFTFICELSSSRVQSKFSSPLTKFILKWLPLSQAINEKACSEFVGNHGFNVPDIYFIPNPLNQNLGAEASKIKPAMGTLLASYSLITMPYLPAINFESAILNGKLFSLPPDDWKTILVTLGKISVFDTLIGNNDRLARFDSDGSIEPKPSMNTGNVMLGIMGGELSRVFIIDTGAIFDLRKACEIGEEDKENFSSGFLFGSSELSDEEGEKEAMTSPSDMLKPLNSAFTQLTSDPDSFSLHLADSLHNAMNEALLSTTAKGGPEKFSLISQKYLHEGILLGIDYLKKTAPLDFPKTSCTFCGFTQTLIEINLGTLRETPT